MSASTHVRYTKLGRAVTLLTGSALFICAPAVARGAPTEPGTLTYPLAPSASQCGMCHAFANPAPQATLPNHSPMVWQGSAMAHSARDPVFWGALALAAQDHPEETIDCVRCHVPSAFLSGRGAAQVPADLLAEDLDGIGCDLCHRMLPDPDVPIGNARYTLDDTDINGAVAKAGPWTYGQDAPNHSWRQDLEFLPSADMCGVCHDVTTPRPRLRGDGTVIASGFNEQRTYSEWANSAFARAGEDAATCQDCHMPAVEDVAGCAAFSESGIVHPTGGRRHDLAGVHLDLTSILQQNYGSAGRDEIDDVFFDATRAAQEAISTQAVALTVEAPMTFDETRPATLPLTVQLENLSGHKLPTGYSEGRVMWIEVEGLLNGETIFGSGRWRDNAIESDEQVRRYEGIAERLSDGQQNHLLLNDHWRLDTRIPPKGLAPDPETDPVTDRYPLTSDGYWSSVDTVPYEFALSAETQTLLDEALAAGQPATVEVHVRVRYLINTPAYLAQLLEDNVTNLEGERLAAAYAEIGGPQPITLAAWSALVRYTGSGEASDTQESDNQGCGCHAVSASTRGSRGAGGWLLLACLAVFGRIRPNGRN